MLIPNGYRGSRGTAVGLPASVMGAFFGNIVQEAAWCMDPTTSLPAGTGDPLVMPLSSSAMLSLRSLVPDFAIAIGPDHYSAIFAGAPARLPGPGQPTVVSNRLIVGSAGNMVTRDALRTASPAVRAEVARLIDRGQLEVCDPGTSHALTGDEIRGLR